MVVRWPGKIPAGDISELAWTFADFLPTAADLAGADLPTGVAVDGKSIAPTLLGEAQPELADRFLYWEFFGSGFQQASRWRDWKAVRLKPGEPLRLFDLASDPGERNDVSAQNPEIVGRFEAFLATARTRSKAWPVKEGVAAKKAQP